MFNPQIDRAAIRRTDYPAMGENQLVTESQAHKWVVLPFIKHNSSTAPGKRKGGRVYRVYTALECSVNIYGRFHKAIQWLNSARRPRQRRQHVM